MSPLFALHLIAVGVWVGVIAAETVIELDGKKDDASLIKASKLHYTTDIWIEIPSFITVLLTGILMLTETHLQGLFLVKVICGLIAVIANLICVYGVFVRNQHAVNHNIHGVRSTEPVLVVGGIGFIPSFIAAIAIAAYLTLQ